MTGIPRLLAAALVIFLTWLHPASAKVVAIVFDTSGSMENRYNLPAFGMQLLAGTIDGRAGADRLMTLTFDAYARNYVPFAQLGSQTVPLLPAQLRQAIRTYAITSEATHQSAVDGVRRDFRSVQDLGTPYGPIEVMLDALSREARQGEETVFIVISDGAYGSEDGFDAGGARAELARRFEAYRAAIPGPVRAEYLFIADRTQERELRDTVNRQGVRDALLEAFNGPARRPDGELEGSWFVSNKDALWEALQDIVARVSGTDRQAQRRLIQLSGSTVSIDSPLSIARLVSVSTAPARGGAAPEVRATSFGVAPSETRRLTARMNAGDIGLGADPLAGIVQQQWFQVAAPPGRHTLDYTGPVDRDVFLLFQSAAVARLVAIDAENGREIAADASGGIRVASGRSYVLAAQVLDGPNQEPVRLSTLPQGLSMTLTLDGAAPLVEAMTIESSADRGVLPWVAGAPGAYEARARVAIPGFVSAFSNAVPITVVDSKAALAMSPFEPADACAQCPAGEIASRVAPGQSEALVGTFEITATAEGSGGVSFAPSKLPEGFELRGEDGAAIDPGAVLPFEAGERRRFSVVRKGQASPEDIRLDARELTIAAAPAGDWTGDAATQSLRVRLAVDALQMKLVSVSRAPAGGPADTLEAPGGELAAGAYSASFSLVGLLEPPDPAEAGERIAAGARGLTGSLIGFTSLLSPPGSATYGFELRPRTHFCFICVLGVASFVSGSETWLVDIAYADKAGLQSASAQMRLAVPLQTGPFTLSCLLDALILFLAYVAIRWVVAMVTTHRFPKGSVVQIDFGSDFPRIVSLDRGAGVWWRGFGAWLFGNPDQVKVVEGLRLKATPGGALLDLRRTAPSWTPDSLGQSLVEYKRENPRKPEYKVQWGETLQNDYSRTTSLQLKRRKSD